MKQTGWKLDVDVYDRRGWNSFTYQFPIWGGIQKRDNDEIVIRFDSADDTGINDDFYFERYEQVVLSSKDAGRSWERIEPEWQYHIPLRLSDGTLVEVVESHRMVSRQEKRQRLKELGIEHIWPEEGLLVWDFWPESMAEQLKAEGLGVWDRKVGLTPDQVYLPEGVVATVSPSSVTARRSTDGGVTWQEKQILSLESFGRFGACVPGAAVLVDDTVLIPCYGTARNVDSALHAAEVFILRSQDRGESYELIKLAALAGVNLSETSLVAHPSGRVVALMRSGRIHQSHSDDGGKTWSPPTSTGMDGYPLHAIGLASGNILCTYAHRDHPGGVRGALSYDRGETWDVAREKILRDDVLSSSYIGGTGNVQLDDGTIFTFYSLVKPVTPKPVDTIARDKLMKLQPRFHCYIAASRYTEDYVKALG